MNFSITFQKLLKGMVRVIMFTVATILVAALLSGCGHPNTGTLEGHGKRFEVIYSSANFRVVVDTETGVEYAVSGGAYNCGTFTMLYDSYGNPYVFPGFDAREDALPGQKIG